MNLVIKKDYDAMTEASLEILLEQIKTKPDAVISFTTGASPEGMMKRFADEVNNGLDISGCIFMNLDEYVCDPAESYSVHYFMHELFYNQIKQQPKAYFMPQGNARDQAAEIKRYKEIIAKYPRDLQFLGLGINGHIGANEPGTSFDAEFFVNDLAESTIVKTRKQFNLTQERTPLKMYTMGLKDIMAAKTVVLQVSGGSKAEAMKAMVEGPVDESCPASVLRNHPNFICVADEEAAALLQQ